MASQLKGTELGMSVLGHPLIVPLRVSKSLLLQPAPRAMIQFFSYSVFLTFCLCSWVQLKVPNVILECYCLQRNTIGKGHCSREKQHMHVQRQEPLCALQRPACPPKGRWHPRLGPAAHGTPLGYSTFQFWDMPSMLGDFPNSIVWGNQSMERTWGARQKMIPS